VWGKGNGTWPFNLYEESIRVPLIWNHPGRIRGGLDPAPMVSSYDYFPTLLDYLGLPPHKDSRLPGHSYAEFLHGKNPIWRNRIYFEYSYMRGLRTETAEIHPADQGMAERNVRSGSRSRREAGRHLRPEVSRVGAGLRGELDGFFEASGAPPIEQWRSTTRQKLAGYNSVRP